MLSAADKDKEKDEEIDELKRTMRKLQQRNSILEGILNTKQAELERQEAELLTARSVIPSQAPSPAPQLATGLSPHTNALRLAARELRTEVRAARTETFMLGGGTVDELRPDWARSLCNSLVVVSGRRVRVGSEAPPGQRAACSTLPMRMCTCAGAAATRSAAHREREASARGVTPRRCAPSLLLQLLLLLLLPLLLLLLPSRPYLVPPGALCPHLGASLLTDRLLCVAELAAVHHAPCHAQCVQWHRALPPPRPPPWRCFTLELASGELLHLAARTDDEARDWVLGLHALRRRAAAAAAAAELAGRTAAAAGPAATVQHFLPRTSAAFRPPCAAAAAATPTGRAAATDPTACSECQLLWQRARMRLRARAHSEGRPMRSLLAAAVVKAREQSTRSSSSTQGAD